MLRNQQQKNLQEQAQQSLAHNFPSLRSEHEWLRAFVNPIQVTVMPDNSALQHLPPGTTVPVVTRVEVKQTVHQLKEIICASLKAGLPPARLQLFYNRGLLQDHRTLAFFNIPDQASITFSVTPVNNF